MKKMSFDLPEYLLKDLLDNPFVGIIIADSEGKIIAINDAHSRITKTPKESIMGTNVVNWVENEHASVSATKQVLKTKKPTLMHQILKNGASHDTSAMPVFDEEGKLAYVINYLVDVTELAETRRKLKKLMTDKEVFKDKYKLLLEVLNGNGSIIYQSEKMETVVERARKVADSSATVLITGPSGSGKELIANILHEESIRNNKPFVKINCAAIPENLLESELFGYMPGAFTGGSRNGKKGLFEAADGGSILLDEIGEMPYSIQAKLLRVIQEQEVRRIGSDKTVKINVRIIASTNADLKELIEKKLFREDLYYRLNVIELNVPSLAERKEDIPLLIEHFISVFNTKYNFNKHVNHETVKYLASKEYTGNVRELRNVVERLVIQSENDEININDAIEIFGEKQTEISVFSEETSYFGVQENTTLKEMMEAYEKRILEEYSKKYRTATELGKVLGVDRTTISRKMEKYKL